MLQSELNVNWIATILYYCYQINSNYFFDLNANQCGNYGYDGSNNIYIISWNLNVAPYNIAQPSKSTLLGYTLSTVLTFYNQYYLWPSNIIATNQLAFVHMTTTDILAMYSPRIPVGYLVYDTTAKVIKKYTGPLLGWVGI